MLRLTVRLQKLRLSLPNQGGAQLANGIASVSLAALARPSKAAPSSQAPAPIVGSQARGQSANGASGAMHLAADAHVTVSAHHQGQPVSMSLVRPSASSN